MADAQTLRTQYRVGDFVTWQREGTLVLNPNFQRRPVWEKGAKSYLIDTILRGLPMPIIFLRDIRTDLKTLKSGRDVVDGQQRIESGKSRNSWKRLLVVAPPRAAFGVLFPQDRRCCVCSIPTSHSTKMAFNDKSPPSRRVRPGPPVLQRIKAKADRFPFPVSSRRPPRFHQNFEFVTSEPKRCALPVVVHPLRKDPRQHPGLAQA
jgi:hypothetical protein